MQGKKTIHKVRRKIVQIALFATAVVFLTEVVFFFAYYQANPTLVNGLKTEIYLIRFLLLPTLLNVLLVLIGFFLNKSKKYSETFKNYVVVTLLILVTGVVMCTHYVFPPLICAIAVPLFISTIFGNRKLTTITFIVGITFIVLSFFESFFEFRKGEENLIFDYIIGFIFVVCCYTSSLVIILYQKAKTSEAIQSYKVQMELYELLKLDQLTGLYNHTTFHQIINEEVLKTRITKENLCIAVIDIDNFKRVNDTYGHLQGDIVLEVLASIMRKHSNENIVSSRYGGEEFAILFKNYNDVQAKDIVLKILKEFNAYQFDFLKQENITFSCGIAQYRNDNMDSRDFFDMADKAMYQAKAKGKNRIYVVE